MDSLQQVLRKFDNCSEKKAEIDVASAVKALYDKNDTSQPDIDWLAEAMAFEFVENYQHNETGWDTYFGPMLVLNNEDGTYTESPSIRKVTPEIISYWMRRAIEAKNPILRARYAGLVWDFSERVTGKVAPVEMAQINIDSIIQISAEDCHRYEVDVITKLERALSLALSLNDHNRIINTRDAIILYEDKIAVDEQPGLWGFSYDLLVENKKVVLENEQVEKIIRDIETRLERLSSNTINQLAYMWAAEAAAVRLAKFYRKANRNDEIKDVILMAGRLFESASKDALALRSSAWLEHIHSVYLQYGLRDEADRILIKLRELGTSVDEEMTEVVHTVEIPIEEIKQYITAMLEGNLETAFSRIVFEYIPRKKEVESQLIDLANKAPLSFLVTRRLQDHKGRSVSTIGSLEEDLIGNIVNQISQNMGISSIFLRDVLDGLRKKFDLSTKYFLDYFYLSPSFNEDKRRIIELGVENYLQGEFLTATHLLIPQIEDAIRNLVEKSGGVVLKPNRSGGLHLRTLDELLRDDLIIRIFDEDIALYFRVLLTDPRGWNLRNNICHGVTPANLFGRTIADRVIHILLCLAQVRKQEKTA